MPNWNYNSVRIDAPLKEVKRYTVKNDNCVLFNMHLLFPDVFSSDDATGEKGWDYDWSVENTGSKWLPDIEIDDNGNDSTYISYDTARAPNNLTLKRLHELTGWTITNEYEEGGMGFE